MESFKAIDFHQTRDFGRKMSATFEFVRQNFQSLGKSILLIAGPPVLVASLLMGSFVDDIIGLSVRSVQDPEVFARYVQSSNFWLQIALAVIFFLVSGVSTTATIYNYILLYDEKRTNRIQVSEVWERVRSTFWMYLGTMLMLTLLGIVAYIILIIPVGLFAAVSPLMAVFSFLFLLMMFIYLMVSVSLVFIIRAYERIGFFAAVVRSLKLIQGKWWSTFGLTSVLYLLVGVVSYIFMVPFYIMTVVKALHQTDPGVFQAPGTTAEVLTILFFSLYYLAQMTLYALPIVGIAFQYFNLVERKEARGLMSRIETIGQSPSNPNANIEEHY